MPVLSHETVRGLHKGEAETLQLALEKKADAVLMDDLDGRSAAKRLGLTPIFTLAIMELAAEKGFLDFHDAVGKLRATSFFISGKILDAALERDKQRKARQGPS
jgi:predicted nucleic acid-binding protein